MDRADLLRRAADLIWDHAESGCATDPKAMADALAAARKAGISLDEIAAHNHNRTRTRT